MIFTLFLFLQSYDPAIAVGSIIVLGIIALIAYSVGIEKRKKDKALEEASRWYQNSLSQLKADPTNADLRQTTLQLGRTYSNLTRNKKGVTIFDEVALSNNISAACAGATNIHENKVPKPDQTIELRLQRLADLKAKGLIDDDEYTARRERILDEV